ncbi:uncharacterized protein LOC113799490 [Dermatophagoides pteronyssinus]|uniref:uncharacterized protein LOC113799490 n=1 Tax=Dermatophagoides pteronyssinus TaxID=6956 RepID=UPI003F67B43B
MSDSNRKKRSKSKSVKLRLNSLIGKFKSGPKKSMTLSAAMRPSSREQSRSSSRSKSRSRSKLDSIDVRLSRSQIKLIADLVSKNIFKLFVCSKHQRIMRKARKEKKIQTCCMTDHIAHSVIQLQLQQEQQQKLQFQRPQQQQQQQPQPVQSKVIPTPRSRTPRGLIKLINSSWLNLLTKSPKVLKRSKSKKSKPSRRKSLQIKSISKSILNKQSLEQKSKQIEENSQQSVNILIQVESDAKHNDENVKPTLEKSEQDIPVAKSDQDNIPVAKSGQDNISVAKSEQNNIPVATSEQNDIPVAKNSNEKSYDSETSSSTESQLEKAKDSIEIQLKKLEKMDVVLMRTLIKPRTMSELFDSKSAKQSQDEISPLIKMNEKSEMIISKIQKPIKSSTGNVVAKKELNSLENPDTSYKIRSLKKINDKDDSSKLNSMKMLITTNDSIIKSKAISLSKVQLNSEGLKNKNLQNDIHLSSSKLSTTPTKSTLQSSASRLKAKNVGKTISSFSISKQMLSLSRPTPSPLRKSMIQKDIKVDRKTNGIESILSKNKQQPQSSTMKKEENEKIFEKQKSITKDDNDDYGKPPKSPELLRFSSGLVSTGAIHLEEESESESESKSSSNDCEKSSNAQTITKKESSFTEKNVQDHQQSRPSTVLDESNQQS